jgi:hypothetical protein
MIEATTRTRAVVPVRVLEIKRGRALLEDPDGNRKWVYKGDTYRLNVNVNFETGPVLR